jgi:peroxiredoxin
MNKSIISVLLLITIFSCSNKDEYDGFIIEGNISGIKSDSMFVYMASESESNSVSFKEEIKDGKFVIRGKLDTPDMFIIKISGVKDSLRFFLDNNFITITGVAEDLPGSLISGALTNEIAVEHEEELENLSINNKIDDLLNKLNTPEITPFEKQGIVNEIIKFNQKSRQIDSAFLEKHPKSSYSLYLLAKRSDRFSVNFREQRAAIFSSIPEFSSNHYLKEVANSVENDSKLRKGGTAPDFSLKTNNSANIKFSDIYKNNKVTLLYFWAGWCNACSEYNNFLKSIYYSFQWRGLEIVGISIDKESDIFENSVKSQGITWQQYSELKGWKSSIAGKYQIDEIPSAILIDSTGKIIAYKPQIKILKQIIRENLLTSEELYQFYKSYSDSLKNKERVP